MLVTFGSIIVVNSIVLQQLPGLAVGQETMCYIIYIVTKSIAYII